VREALQQPVIADAGPLHFRLNGTAFEGLLHRHQGVLILELEIHVENFQPRNVAGNQTHLGRMLQRLQAATTLQALYDISVKEIQAMTGYDRVLIYRFEEEGHGQVIAEASDPSMEVFNGLFFPASDIPEQARELYRTNWLRIIPMPIISQCRWCQAAPGHPDPLDLSFATLRSVSPIHCQYMKNMGVLSSMSISLLKGDKLWGLISCGNRQPLHVPHELRSACQTIGQVLSLQISAMEALELSRQREEKVEALALLNQAMIDSPQNVFDGLANSRKH
jgi:light-regulated signal transduction histidine kinase (bacteriophytochrome)